LHTDLRSLFSHTLIVKNVKDPQRDRTFSLLENLPETEENLITHQIEYCFPVSEDRVVIITRNRVASLWNLEPIKPVCDKKSRIMGLHSYDRWSTLISSDIYSFHLKDPMRAELKAPAIELFLKEVVLIQYNPFKNKFNPGALNQSSWGL
jgi:hypothetical protein